MERVAGAPAVAGRRLDVVDDRIRVLRCLERPSEPPRFVYGCHGKPGQLRHIAPDVVTVWVEARA
jgi:hypothetical protein